jgi:hypothetical protein
MNGVNMNEVQRLVELERQVKPRVIEPTAS